MLKPPAQFALMFSLEELFCSVDNFCRGFEPQWKQQLLGSGLQLRNRPRSIIETIIDQLLKNISQIEHSRHRSPVNGFVNILGGLIAYCHQPKKPSWRSTTSRKTQIDRLSLRTASLAKNPLASYWLGQNLERSTD